MKTAKHKNGRKMAIALASLLSFGVTTFATGCSISSEITGIHMSSNETLDVFYGAFSYEGINVSVDFRDGTYKEIPLTEEMISEVERLKFFKMGPQAIEVVYRNKYSTTMNVNVKPNQFKDSYELVGGEFVYDGEPHAVALNQELPEGATISYPYGNIFVNAGSYEVVGVMRKNGYESKTLTTMLNILPASRDADQIVFQDTTYVFNNEMRSIEATNVPEGVEVSYETFNSQGGRVSKVVNAGTYRVVAHFTDTSPNYAKIPDMTAMLTIQKAEYDLTGIELKNETKVYDGQHFEAHLTNEAKLPKTVSVRYSYKNEAGDTVLNNASVGVYTMIAEFVCDPKETNYLPIEQPMTATLTVTHQIIEIDTSKVTFDSESVNFDEEVHSLSVNSTYLPEGVEVTYSDNNGQIYAGEYTITAYLSATDPNKAVSVSEMTAVLVINRVRRSVMVYNDVTKAYDKDFSGDNIKVRTNGENKEAYVEGIDESVFHLVSLDFSKVADNSEVTPNDFEIGHSYKFVATFEYLNESMNNSVILSSESDLFTYMGA